MRVGVVSDTHDNLPNVRRIVEIFAAARVERIVHTGDITRARTLELFAELTAPLFGVFGNNDVERPALETAASASGFTLADPPLRLHWAGREIVVVHDPRDLAPAELGFGRVALHGHTHRPALERPDGGLVFNPGECAGMLRGHNVVGVVDLVTLSVELERF